MKLDQLCSELVSAFPLKFAAKYEPLGFIFPAVNLEARINYRKLYEREFLNLYNGLMLRGADRVNRVFCVVFPGEEVIKKMLECCHPGDFIFTHHCCGFDDIKGFVPLPAEAVLELKAKKISLYSLHAPFDVNSCWSTSVQLAKSLGIDVLGEFSEVREKTMGVFGKPPVKDLNAFAALVAGQLGNPDVTVILNGKSTKINRVAVLAGGGGYANLVNDAFRYDCDTYLTGTVIETVEVEAAQEANTRFRQKAEELGINLIGGGHYHTEKPAVEKMTGFFKNLGLAAEFAEEPIYLQKAGC